MTICTIRLMNPTVFRNRPFMLRDDVATVRASLKAGEYDIVARIDTDKTGKDAAEEMFDLTNNPALHTERETLYGDKRSISAGDIVTVGDTDYLCLSIGWQAL